MKTLLANHDPRHSPTRVCALIFPARSTSLLLLPWPALSPCPGFSKRHLVREPPSAHTFSVLALFIASHHHTQLFVELFFGYLAHKDTSSTNCIHHLPLHPQGLAQYLLSEVVVNKGTLPPLHVVQHTRRGSGSSRGPVSAAEARGREVNSTLLCSQYLIQCLMSAPRSSVFWGMPGACPLLSRV